MKNMTSKILQVGTVALAVGMLAGCGGGGDDNNQSSNPTGTISGSAAVGAPMANASVTIACKNGNAAGTANANGAYSLTFAFAGPCAITASNGTATLHSIAPGSGVYNVTPLTELLVTYIAGQFGTTAANLLAGLGSNTAYQNALTNNSVITSAVNAVAAIIKTQYGITLTSSSFLTTPFVPGQPGLDADLDALQTAGAITSTGQPAASLTTTVQSAGTSAGAPPSGATGGTGSTTG
jgi:hypothetical protein